MTAGDLIKNLLLRQQLNFIVEVFIQLDVKSLISCLDVCEVWRDFLQNYVLINHRKTILRRAWSQLSTESFDYQEILLNGSISHLTSYHDVIYVSYTNGKYRKITEEKQDEDVRTEINVQEQVNTCSSQVKVGENIELIEVHGRSRDNDQVTTVVLVMAKNTNNILYSGEIAKDNVTTFVWRNSVFIRNLSSSSLKELLFTFSPDSQVVISMREFPLSSSPALVTDQYLILTSGEHLKTLSLVPRGDITDPVLTSETSREVRDLSCRGSSLIIQSEHSLSLLLLPASPPPSSHLTTRLRLETEDRILSVQHNNFLLAVLDLHHRVQFYPWLELEGEKPVARPVLRLRLPTVGGAYSLAPCITLTDQALLWAEKGSNRLHKLSVWQHRLS